MAHAWLVANAVVHGHTQHVIESMDPVRIPRAFWVNSLRQHPTFAQATDDVMRSMVFREHEPLQDARRFRAVRGQGTDSPPSNSMFWLYNLPLPMTIGGKSVWHSVDADRIDFSGATSKIYPGDRLLVIGVLPLDDPRLERGLSASAPIRLISGTTPVFVLHGHPMSGILARATAPWLRLQTLTARADRLAFAKSLLGKPELHRLPRNDYADAEDLLIDLQRLGASEGWDELVTTTPAIIEAFRQGRLPPEPKTLYTKSLVHLLGLAMAGEPLPRSAAVDAAARQLAQAYRDRAEQQVAKAAATAPARPAQPVAPPEPEPSLPSIAAGLALRDPTAAIVQIRVRSNHDLPVRTGGRVLSVRELRRGMDQDGLQAVAGSLSPVVHAELLRVLKPAATTPAWLSATSLAIVFNFAHFPGQFFTSDDLWIGSEAIVAVDVRPPPVPDTSSVTLAIPRIWAHDFDRSALIALRQVPGLRPAGSAAYLAHSVRRFKERHVGPNPGDGPIQPGMHPDMSAEEHARIWRRILEERGANDFRRLSGIDGIDSEHWPGIIDDLQRLARDPRAALRTPFGREIAGVIPRLAP